MKKEAKIHFDYARKLIFDKCRREPGIIVKPTDKYYKTISLDDVARIMRERKLHEIPYEEDFFDCDDYAICLAAILCRYAVGQVSIKNYEYDVKDKRHYHALNIFIDHDLRVWYADAQNYTITPPGKTEYSIYFLEM
jgi:(2Fe-2S) ferredoxin